MCATSSPEPKHRHVTSALSRSLVIVASILAAVSTTGCSMQAWYGGVRFAAENECRRQPPSETQGCLARLNTLTYDEYARKRTGRDP